MGIHRARETVVRRFKCGNSSSSSSSSTAKKIADVLIASYDKKPADATMLATMMKQMMTRMRANSRNAHVICSSSSSTSSSSACKEGRRHYDGGISGMWKSRSGSTRSYSSSNSSSGIFLEEAKLENHSSPTNRKRWIFQDGVLGRMSIERSMAASQERSSTSGTLPELDRSWTRKDDEDYPRRSLLSSGSIAIQSVGVAFPVVRGAGDSMDYKREEGDAGAAFGRGNDKDFIGGLPGHLIAKERGGRLHAAHLPGFPSRQFSLIQSRSASNSTSQSPATGLAPAVNTQQSGKGTKALEKKKDPESAEADLRILRTLSVYLWPRDNPDFRRRVLIALGLLVGSKILNVQVPFLFKYAVDGLSTAVGASGATAASTIAGNPMLFAYLGTPTAVLLGYGIARAGAAACNELRNAVFAKVAQGTIRTVARKVFAHLHQLDLPYHLSRQTGALNRTIDRGTRAINFILSSMVFNVVPTILEISLVAGILAYKFGAPFAWVTTITVAAYTGFTFSVTQWRTKFRQDMNAADNAASSRATDSLLNYETVQYFNNEKHEVQTYDVFLKKYEEASLKTQTSLSALNLGQNLIFSCALSVAMVMCGHAIMSGQMTIGDLVMVNGLLFQLSLPLNFLGSVYRETRQSLIDMHHMFSLLEVQPGIKDAPHAKPLEFKGGAITFDNVSFGYVHDRPILNSVSFEVPAGKSVAVVGTSGSGKSTILRLLFRFFDPKSGAVKIDGQDIKDVTLESVRKSMAVVPQDTVLFNDTIFYNIQYGKMAATEEEVYAAAKQASIHDVIMRFPEGYRTKVGERGLKLSGGEKQRVALARAFLKAPPILLCDEATSALDSTTEGEILGALDSLAQNRTAIFIAHRLTTAAQCDEILVLENGSVVEQGSHDDLLARGGRYAQLWGQQNYTEVDEIGHMGS